MRATPGRYERSPCSTVPHSVCSCEQTPWDHVLPVERSRNFCFMLAPSVSSMPLHTKRWSIASAHMSRRQERLALEHLVLRVCSAVHSSFSALQPQTFCIVARASSHSMASSGKKAKSSNAASPPPSKKLKTDAAAAAAAAPGISPDLQREPSVIALLDCQSRLEKPLQAWGPCPTNANCDFECFEFG